MQFVLILAVLAALVISENSPSCPVADVMVRLVALGCGIAVVTLFAAVSSRVVARRLQYDYKHRHLILKRFRHLRQVHTLLWLVVACATAYYLDWAQVVRFNWQLDHVFLLDDLLILMPVVLPLILSWAVFYNVDRAIGVGDVGESMPPGHFSTRWQYVTMHVRHYLGVLLMPVLALLAIQDAVRLMWPEFSDSAYSSLVYLPPMILLFLMFPILLGYVWETKRLVSSPLRRRLERCAFRTRFRAKDILIWNTDGMLVNAAVAGFVPRFRYVFLTDGLVARLNDDEIEAVFGHEVGHCYHKHLFLRVLAIVAPLSVWMLISQFQPNVIEKLQEWQAAGGLGAEMQMGLVTLAAMGAYVFVIFGAYSKLLERQADIFGCRALSPHPTKSAVDTYVSALEKLGQACGNREVSSWQHDSIAKRVDFLYRAAHDPYFELHFQRKVRLLGWLLIVLVISPIVCQCLPG